MTTVTNEIDDYCERVGAALSGLAPAVRDDLIEDLPEHLVEVLAEGDGSLYERLGAPEDYAAELVAAAGLAPETGRRAGAGAAAAERLVRRTAQLVGRCDLRLGAVVGYGRARDLLSALQPGWWVLRGWVAAQYVAWTDGGTVWQGLVPSLGGNRVLGLVLTGLLVVASVWVGRRSLTFGRTGRRFMIALSVLLAGWTVVLASHMRAEAGPAVLYAPAATDAVSDVYVYDQNGRPVDGARLYDQTGAPIQLGSPYCQDQTNGRSSGTDDQGVTTWLFPMCPQDRGPFSSGPGAVASSGSPAAAGTSGGSSGAAGASPSTTSRAPSARPSVRASATASRPARATATATP